jgi:hypothetical protein
MVTKVSKKNTANIFHAKFYFKGEVKLKAKQSITGLDRPRGFQEVEAPGFHDSQHMKVVRLSAYAPAAFTPRKYFWYSFLLEAESTPGP